MGSIFGAMEEFFSETVYPNRYPVAVGLVLGLGLSVFVAYRLGWHQLLWQHRYLTAAAGAPVLLFAVLGGYYTLSPLWERSTLCEDNPLTQGVDESLFEGKDCDRPTAVAAGDEAGSPTGTPAALETPTASASPTELPPTPAEEPTAEPFTPRVVAQGTWAGADDFHFAEGQALLLEVEPGRHTVRVEEFSVRNGPDLFVYLSPSPDGLADGAINLGGLKATDGAFNYEVPEGTDVSAFRSVIVWCRQFSVLFGTATLEGVGEG